MINRCQNKLSQLCFQEVITTLTLKVELEGMNTTSCPPQSKINFIMIDASLSSSKIFSLWGTQYLNQSVYMLNYPCY